MAKARGRWEDQSREGEKEHDNTTRIDLATLTVSGDGAGLLDDGPVSSLERGHTTGRELGQKVGPLGGLHVNHDELDVAASEDGGGTGTGDTPAV
jgi:hypothetical protein